MGLPIPLTFEKKTLQHCFIKTFSDYIKKVDNLGRLEIIGTHIDYNIKLRIIADRRLEVVFNEGYNIGNDIENNNPQWLIEKKL